MCVGAGEGFNFAAKLVRGAYMHLEREHAAKLGFESPVHERLEDTHANFDRYSANWGV